MIYIYNVWLIILCIFFYYCEHGIFADEVPNVPMNKLVLSKKCDEVGDCLLSELIMPNCKEKCGCDKSNPFYWNETSGECMLNLKAIMLFITEKHDAEEKNRRQAEMIFQGILVSGIMVVTWASVCIFAACCYCCRMKISDRKLRKNVKQLSQRKSQMIMPPMKIQIKPKPRETTAVVLS